MNETRRAPRPHMLRHILFTVDRSVERRMKWKKVVNEDKKKKKKGINER